LDPTATATATNPFANRSAAEIFGFMPTAQALAQNLASETAIHSPESARWHTAVYEEVNRPLAAGENLYGPEVSSKRRDNIISGWVPRDGSEMPMPDIINEHPVLEKEEEGMDMGLNKWGEKKTMRRRRAGVKSRAKWEKGKGVYPSVARERHGGGSGAEVLRVGAQKALGRGGYWGGEIREYGSFEDTDDFFHEEGEEDTMDLNPESPDFTASAIMPVWRKDEPDNEGKMGAAIGCPEMDEMGIEQY
jgi:hypothetical protein